MVRQPSPPKVHKAVEKLKHAERPLFIIGSQAVVESKRAWDLQGALERMGIPCYLSGMARGLLGAGNELQMRHKRREALKRADVVVLAGVPADFRLDYGNHIKKSSFFISANRRSADIFKNRMPDLACVSDAGAFLRRVADELEGDARREDWLAELRERDAARDAQIEEQSTAEAEGGMNALALCKVLENQLDDESVLVADGGDFVATASYIAKPRSPLSWLDPGVFGTLGVGGGFALGAKAVRPNAEVWILYGDGSAGYSITEFDTYVRRKMPVIALVGNDASWQQIARDQGELLGDLVGTELLHTDYHVVAEGYGGKGFLLEKLEDAPRVFAEAKRYAREGTPVLINAIIGKTDFRKGSISV
jgi:acetolactate synthase-1/2/3 large subunit